MWNPVYCSAEAFRVSNTLIERDKMFILTVLTLLLLFWRSRKVSGLNEEYLSIETSQGLKGIFFSGGCFASSCSEHKIGIIL